MEEKIFSFLAKHKGYFSGEELSSLLKISRQALWKHIHDLKELGFEIEAVPHLGYRLVSFPDRLYDFLIQHNLKTKVFGKKIFYFDSLSSTMDTATTLALKGAREGEIVLAETQSKGRGRLGRNWYSPKYKGLYFSIILRPKIPLEKISLLTLLAGVSICEALESFIPLHPQLKWPNDIILNDKKIGGILTEIKAEVDAINFVILGIGLNINNDRDSLPTYATSLKQEGKKNFSRLEILQKILQHLEHNYFLFQQRGFEKILPRWRQFCLTLGKRVKVHLLDKSFEGQAVDIDQDGGLLIRKDSGFLEKITAGDIIHCR